jgi:hypothetical protein
LYRAVQNHLLLFEFIHVIRRQFIILLRHASIALIVHLVEYRQVRLIRRIGLKNQLVVEQFVLWIDFPNKEDFVDARRQRIHEFRYHQALLVAVGYWIQHLTNSKPLA